MKNILVVLTFMTCIFTCVAEAGQQRLSSSAIIKIAEQEEKQLLSKNCYIIKANIASQFSGMGMGSRRGSGFQNTVNQAITDYLYSVGTPVALQY